MNGANDVARETACNTTFGFQVLPPGGIPENPRYHGIEGVSTQLGSRPAKKLNVLVVTSVRGAGSKNLCGFSLPADHDSGILLTGNSLYTNQGRKYIAVQSAAESIYRASQPMMLFEGFYNLAGIVVDDLPKDELKGEKNRFRFDYAITPQAGKDWIINPKTSLVAQVPISHLPSEFRNTRPCNRTEFSAGKIIFQNRVIKAAKECNADIILCEHLEFDLDPTQMGEFAGRIVTVRPAFEYDPVKPLLSPAQEIEAAKDALIKRSPQQPDLKLMMGAVMQLVVNYDGTGPVIADCAQTPIVPQDTIPSIRIRNQALSMAKVTKFGLAQLAYNWHAFQKVIEPMVEKASVAAQELRKPKPVAICVTPHGNRCKPPIHQRVRLM